MKQNRGLTVWTTAIPLYLELLAVSSISLMDVFFMSLVSDKAVAALGVCTQVLMIFTLLIRTLTGGAGAVAAQHLGAGNSDKASTAFIYTLMMAAGCGAVFALLLFLLRDHIGEWLGLSGETLEITCRYLAIIGPAFLLLAIRSGYSAIISVKGKASVNLYCSLIANLVNIIFNCIFVLGWFGLPKLGVEGVAWATVIAYGVQLFLLSWISHRYLDIQLNFSRDIFRRLRELTRPIMGIAIPNSGDLLSHSIYQVAIVMVAIRIGDEAVASHTYLRQIIVVVMLWAYSIGQGQAIWTAHLVGAKAFDKAEIEMKKSIFRCLSFSLPVTLLIFVFIDSIMRFFTDNATIVNMAGSAMVAYIGIEIGRAFNATLSFSLSAAGHAKYPAFLAVIFNWFVGLAAAYVLGIYFGWGLLGILIGLALDELARAPLLYRRLKSRRWVRA